MRGKFITIEGGEACGKSSLIEGLKAYFQSCSISVRFTREPGGTPLAEALRKVICAPATDGEVTDPLAEFLVFSAARVQHVKEIVAPSLEEGVWVVCDRFFDSSTVYQGMLRGVDREFIADLNRRVALGVQPDLTLLLDCDVEIAMGRLEKRGLELSRFDREGLSFHQRVREGFLQLAQVYPERIATVDATVAAARVLDLSIREIEGRFGENIGTV